MLPHDGIAAVSSCTYVVSSSVCTGHDDYMSGARVYARHSHSTNARIEHRSKSKGVMLCVYIHIIIYNRPKTTTQGTADIGTHVRTVSRQQSNCIRYIQVRVVLSVTAPHFSHVYTNNIHLCEARFRMRGGTCFPNTCAMRMRRLINVLMARRIHNRKQVKT